MVSPTRIVQQYPRHHHPRAGDLDTFLPISCRHDGIYQISKKYLATAAEENYDEGDLIDFAGAVDDHKYRCWTISKSAAGYCSLSTTTNISKTNKNHEEKNHEITITGHEQEDHQHDDNDRNKKEGEFFVNDKKKNYIMKQHQQDEQEDKGEKEESKEDKEEQQQEEPIIVVDEVLFDFGIKYRIIVIQEQMRRGRGGNTAEGEDKSSNSNNMKDKSSSSRKEGHHCYTIFMHMDFFGWDVIEKRATKNLMEIFGKENVFTTASNKSSTTTTTNDHEHEFRLLMHSVSPGHDICIKINSAALPENQDVESTCNCMSNIRIIVLGNDLKLALQSIARRRPASNHFLSHSRGNLSKNDAKEVEQNQQQQRHEEKKRVESAAAASSAAWDHEDDKSSKSNFVFERQESFAIPIQRPPFLNSASKSQFMVVVPQSDRVTVVIPFIYHCQHETESALARVFLQQFEQAQRKCLNERNGKNVPICEYRRSNDPPREMKLFQRKELLKEEAAKETKSSPEDLDVIHHAGYLSLTFLEHHVDDEEKVYKAVSNILMTYDFLDYHIKSSKSFIRSRMRSKKDTLIKKLFDDDQ